jgi:hypothetical protein
MVGHWFEKGALSKGLTPAFTPFPKPVTFTPTWVIGDTEMEGCAKSGDQFWSSKFEVMSVVVCATLVKELASKASKSSSFFIVVWIGFIKIIP